MFVDIHIATSSAGQSLRVTVDLPDGAGPRDLVRALIRDGHLAASAEGTALVAVDGRVCDEDEALASGRDCVILLPSTD